MISAVVHLLTCALPVLGVVDLFAVQRDTRNATHGDVGNDGDGFLVRIFNIEIAGATIFKDGFFNVEERIKCIPHLDAAVA